jgi:hypothetical protein
MAVAEGVITKNTAALLYTPREWTRSERLTMTLDEVKKASKVLPLRARLIFKLAVRWNAARRDFLVYVAVTLKKVT